MNTLPGFPTVQIEEHPFTASHVIDSGCAHCNDAAPTVAQRRESAEYRWRELLAEATKAAEERMKGGG